MATDKKWVGPACRKQGKVIPPFLLIGMLLPGCGGGGGSQETGPVEVLVSACAPSDEAPKLLDQLYLQHRPGAGEVSPSALPFAESGPLREALAAASVAGSIRIPSGVMMDSDTADSAALTESLSNNSPQEAQPLLNPVAVSGFVSVAAGFHPNGSSFTASYPEDKDDYYRITLKMHQLVSLYSVDSSSGASQALCLLNTEGQDTFTPVSGNAVKTLTVPADGDYLLQVHARSQAGLYQLVVGQGSSQSMPQSLLTTEAPFVPLQVLVKWESAFWGERWEERARGVEKGIPAPDGHSMLSPLYLSQDNTGLLDMRDWVHDRLEKTAEQALGVESPAPDLQQATLEAIAELRRQPGVLYAEPNYLRHALSIPNDPYFSTQWHYPLINLPQAWNLVEQSRLAPVRVAVIDSGIRPHVDLTGQVVEGYDFVSNDTDPTDEGGSLHGGSNSYHGTHVAGIIGALTDNQIGVAGVAGVMDMSGDRPVKILPIRVLDALGSGTDADIIEAIKYASGLENRSGILLTEAEQAQVINLSLGGAGFSVAVQEAVNLARARGVVIVAAAGNNGSSAKIYPAANEGVIAVSAVGPDQTLASYSNFGQEGDLWVDVAAPGGNLSSDVDGDGLQDGVFSTWDDDTYLLLQGTSMATPHVAGVLALMRALNPGLTGANIETLLETGSLTTDPGGAGKTSDFGFGLLDASKALAAASRQDVPATLVANPAKLNFGTGLNSLSLRLTNGGNQPLRVTGVSSNQPWLTVKPVKVDENLGGEYEVSVTREGLEIGVYTGLIQVTTDSTEQAGLNVIMQVADPAILGLDAGTHYVLLIRASTREDPLPDTRQLIETASEGQYLYRFLNIDQDEYYLIAGTDMDNDGYICDQGEFCAEYPVLNKPETLKITGDISKLEMTTNYLLGFGQSNAQALLPPGGPLRPAQGYRRLP